MNEKIQSAEELAYKIRERARCLNFESWDQFEDDLSNQLESRDAAQRQAGREEAAAFSAAVNNEAFDINTEAIEMRYAELVKSARKADGLLNRLESFIYKHDLARHCGLEKISRELHEAISNIEK